MTRLIWNQKKSAELFGLFKRSYDEQRELLEFLKSLGAEDEVLWRAKMELREERSANAAGNAKPGEEEESTEEEQDESRKSSKATPGTSKEASKEGPGVKAAAEAVKKEEASLSKEKSDPKRESVVTIDAEDNDDDDKRPSGYRDSAVSAFTTDFSGVKVHTDFWSVSHTTLREMISKIVNTDFTHWTQHPLFVQPDDETVTQESVEEDVEFTPHDSDDDERE